MLKVAVIGAWAKSGGQMIPLTYLRTTGTQFIDLGIKATATMKVECKFKGTELTNGKSFIPIFGAGTQYNSSDIFGFCIQTSSNSVLSYRGTMFNIDSGVGTVFLDDDCIFELSPTSWELNNLTKSISRSGTISSSISNITRNLEMFRFNSNNADLSNIAKANIYYCKIWDGSDLVMDLHPYLIDGVPCMLNEVDGVEFYNAGTGQFEYAKTA